MENTVTWPAIVQAVMTFLAVAGAGAGLWKSVTNKIEALRVSLEAHKLYAAENFLRKDVRDEIIVALGKQEEKLTAEIHALRADMQKQREATDNLAQAVARLAGRLERQN